MNALFRVAAITMSAWVSSGLAAAATAALSIHPDRIVLYGLGSRQHFVVTWTDAQGFERDVTGQTKFESLAPQIARVETAGSVRGVAAGTSRMTAAFDGITAAAEIEVRAAGDAKELSFVKDIVPIFTKFGCAGSNCHGSIRGKAGFKLSLFGYEPSLGLRSHREGGRWPTSQPGSAPEESLILKKPTFQIPHGGGLRFEKDSLPYDAILEWLRAGAKYDSAGSPRLASLSVLSRGALDGRYRPDAATGGHGPLHRWQHRRPHRQSAVHLERRAIRGCEPLRACQDPRAGRIHHHGANPGPGHRRAHFRGHTALRGRTIPSIPANNYIDRFVFEKLRRHECGSFGSASDEHFLRRVYLDVLGTLPTPEETTAFLSIPRTRQASPAHRPDCWNGPNVPTRGPPTSRTCSVWASTRAATKAPRSSTTGSGNPCCEDKPYDRMVSELLVSQGNLFYEPTANFYFVSRKLDPGDVATHVSQAFLGSPARVRPLPQSSLGEVDAGRFLRLRGFLRAPRHQVCERRV